MTAFPCNAINPGSASATLPLPPRPGINYLIINPRATVYNSNNPLEIRPHCRFLPISPSLLRVTNTASLCGAKLFLPPGAVAFPRDNHWGGRAIIGVDFEGCFGKPCPCSQGQSHSLMGHGFHPGRGSMQERGARTDGWG